MDGMQDESSVFFWHPFGMRWLLVAVARWSFALLPSNDHRLPSVNPSG